MGNAFPVSGMSYKNHPDITPRYDTPPQFDPMEGFPRGRPRKVMQVSQQELYSAKVRMVDRDYCSHYAIEFMKCRRQKFPFYSSCLPQKHKYFHCEYEEYVDRMKEFERERRLLVKGKRPPAAAAAA